MVCGHNKKLLPPCTGCTSRKCYVCEGMKKDDAERHHENDAGYKCKRCQSADTKKPDMDLVRLVLEETRLQGKPTFAVSAEALLTALAISVQAHSAEAFKRLLEQESATEASRTESPGEISQVEEDFCDASQPPPISQLDTQPSQTDQPSNNAVRPRLCKSVWTDKVCSTPTCMLAHPPRCTNPACYPRRQGDCSFWHTVRTVKKKGPARSNNSNRGQGNGKKGKPSPQETKRAPTSLKLEADLAKTRLALLKARSKATHRQKDISYAEAASKNFASQASLLSCATQPGLLSQQHSLTTPVPPPATFVPEAALQQLAGQIAAAIAAALKPLSS